MTMKGTVWCLLVFTEKNGCYWQRVIFIRSGFLYSWLIQTCDICPQMILCEQRKENNELFLIWINVKFIFDVICLVASSVEINFPLWNLGEKVKPLNPDSVNKVHCCNELYLERFFNLKLGQKELAVFIHEAESLVTKREIELEHFYLAHIYRSLLLPVKIPSLISLGRK